MVAQITDLPYLCVRNIFSYLPVIDIIYIDRGIPEWTSIQRDYLRKRSHLTLLLGNDDPMHLIQSSLLNIPFEDELVLGNQCKPYRIIKITSDQIEIGHLKQLKLSRLMPSVKHLEVAMNGVYRSSINRSIVPLIKSWAGQLITFKFRYNRWKNLDKNKISLISNDSNQSKHLHSLLECINTRMVKLQCLHIDVFASNCLSEHFKGQADLSILRQLQEFCFHSNDPARMLFEQLHRYATDRLRTIAIGNHNRWEDMLTEFGESTFAKSFVIFSDRPTPLNFCTSFFTTFDSLRSVILYLTDNDQTTLSQLTRYLSPLRNLMHLDLYINTDVSRFDSISDEHIHHIPARVVTLSTGDNCLRSHNALQSRHWPRMFAACRILAFEPNQICNECELFFEDCDDEIYPLIGNYQQCCKRILAPFKSLPNLCKIYCHSIYNEMYKDLLTIAIDQL